MSRAETPRRREKTNHKGCKEHKGSPVSFLFVFFVSFVVNNLTLPHSDSASLRENFLSWGIDTRIALC